MRKKYLLNKVFMKKSLRLFCLLIILLVSLKDSFGKTSGTDTTEKQCRFLPVVGLGAGSLLFYGDVGYKSLNEPLKFKIGYSVSIEENYFKDFNIGIKIHTGKVYGNEKSIFVNENFESSIFAAGLNINYNIIKEEAQTILPFLSAGLEAISFKVNADLKDINGNAYYYWPDGTIRDSYSENASIIQRDYSYETQLNKSMTLGIPFGAGIKLKLSDKMNMRFESIYHYTFNDLLDNVEAGNSDKFLFTSISLHYALGVKSHSSLYKNVDFSAIVENADYDKDGVSDLHDKCPDSPDSIKVSNDGCPLDDDNDGIANYLDQEPNSIPNALVDEKGITITDEYINKKYEADSIAELPTDSIYHITISDSLDLKSVFTKKEVIILPPSTSEETQILYFRSQSSELTAESKQYLQKLAVQLKNNTKTKIEIGGHTDNTGGKELNQKLSLNRAKYVYNYLLTKGVNAKQLSHKGYGDSQPIAPNTTEEGKAKNRRIEIKFISGTNNILQSKESAEKLSVIKPNSEVIKRSASIDKIFTVRFGSSSNELSSEAENYLKELTAYLKENPNAKSRIEGHTDSTGTKASNMQLSTNRAKTIYKNLLSRGVNPKQLSYRGYGDSKPIAPNTTEEGKAKNRRVEIILED